MGVGSVTGSASARCVRRLTNNLMGASCGKY